VPALLNEEKKYLYPNFNDDFYTNEDLTAVSRPDLNNSSFL
jgi:hypothetical protein